MSALLPRGGCDTHLHFYDRRYPSSPAAVLHPPDASVEDYRSVQAELGLDRLVVVQPTTYGLDNSCQLAALAHFGEAARGVMVIDADAVPAELSRLGDAGVRGARFHMLPGGAVGWDHLEPVAALIAPLGWHIQLQLNGRELTGRVDRLLSLPCEVVIDHVGRFMPPVELDHPSFQALLRLLDSGRAWCKLSAPYESSTTGPPHYADLTPLVDHLVARVPERLLWASNWPHPGQADPPTATDLAALLARWLPDPDLRRRVLVDNPATLYDY